MHKNFKEYIKIILLILFVLSIPLVFISLETIYKLKAISSSPTDTQNSLDDYYGNILYSSKSNDASNIRKYLSEIFELMNKREFSKLYALLTDDVKENMFKSEKSFTNYMNSYLDDKLYSPNFSEYEKLNNQAKNVFIVNVSFLPYSTSEQDIINNVPLASKADTFVIYENDDSTYNFSLSKYIGSEKSENNIFENELFSCKLVSTDLYTTQTTFNIEINNKTNKNIFIDKNEIYTITGAMTKYYTPYTSIPANSKTNIYFTIFTGLNLKDSLPDTIYFRGIHAEDNVHFFSLPIKYPVKITSW